MEVVHSYFRYWGKPTRSMRENPNGTLSFTTAWMSRPGDENVERAVEPRGTTSLSICLMGSQVRIPLRV